MLTTSWHRKQSTLGQEAGISRGFMSEVVKGKKKLTFEKRQKIAELCGYSYDNFIQHGKQIVDDSTGNASDQQKPIPFDPAIQILQEALEETGVKINNKQKQAVINILRDKLKESEGKTKEGIKKYLEAFGK